VIGHMGFIRYLLHWSHQYVHRHEISLPTTTSGSAHAHICSQDPIRPDRKLSGCMKNRGAACIMHIAENTEIQLVTRSLFLIRQLLLAWSDELTNTNGEEPARSLSWKSAASRDDR
jgi:hypothetical protein